MPLIYMCDRCVGGIKSDVMRGIFYGVLKKVLNMAPLDNISECITDTVEEIVSKVYSKINDYPEGTSHKEKDIGKRMAIYVAASYVYENFLYAMVETSNWKLTRDINGICACEIMRDIYLLVILQIYSIYMHGFGIHPLVTDIIAIYGTEFLDTILGLVPNVGSLMGKKKALIAPAPTSLEPAVLVTEMQPTGLVTKKLI